MWLVSWMSGGTWYWDNLTRGVTSIFRVACNAFESTYLSVDKKISHNFMR